MAKYPLLWVGLLAIVLRVLITMALWDNAPMGSDAHYYMVDAISYSQHFVPEKAPFWPPGNPLLLAAVFTLTGPSEAAARVLMIALSVLAVVLSMRFARHFSPDPGVAVRTGLLAALYGPSVLLTGQSYSQHLATLCLLAVADQGWEAIRRPRLAPFLWAGLALGVGILTRPSVASLTPVLVVYLLLAVRIAHREGNMPKVRRLFLGAGAAFIVSAALLTPVLLFNHAHDAGWVISTNNERNFFLGNNPYTPNYKTSHLAQRLRGELDPQAREYLDRIYAEPNPRRAMLHESLAYISSHPGTTFIRTLNRFLAFWGFDYLASRHLQKLHGWGKWGLAAALLWEAGSYLSVMLLAAAGWWFASRDGSPWIGGWLLWLIFFYLIPYAISFSGGTYHFPVMGLLFPFAGLALSGFLTPDGRRRLRRQVVGRKAFWVFVLVILAIQVQYAYYAVVYL